MPGYNFQQKLFSLSEDLFLPLQSTQTLMKCSIMLHFIWSTLFAKVLVKGFPEYKGLRTLILRCNYKQTIQNSNLQVQKTRRVEEESMATIADACSALLLLSITSSALGSSKNKKLSPHMRFPIMWHFDKCRLRRACAAPF